MRSWPKGEPGTTGPPATVGPKGNAGPKSGPGPKGEAGEAAIRVVVADGSGLFASCTENETLIAAWCQGSSEPRPALVSGSSHTWCGSASGDQARAAISCLAK